MNNHIKFEIVKNNYSIWKVPTTIKSLENHLDYCPICGEKLYSEFTLIPISTEEKAKVKGLYCRKCDCIYTNEIEGIKKLLMDNYFSKGFTLNGVELWNITAVKKRKKQLLKNKKRALQRLSDMNSIPSAEIIITIQFSNKKTANIIIVSSPVDANTEKYIFHYSTESGREFLSAAYAKQRKRRGTFQNLDYRIIGRPICKKSSSFSEKIVPVELTIETGGGYSSSIYNKNYELTDILLYSPYTKRYEAMRATYNKSNNICFTDISRYRSFVHNYGNPGLLLYFEARNNSFLNYNNLNDESKIMTYGYTANQIDNYSSKYRQSLLAEIIDLNILTPLCIAKFLDFLIETRPHQPSAQAKWREDKLFVENYEPNPKRFLIAK